MGETGQLPLRSHVLAGRFFGADNAGVAEALAALSVEADPVQALRAWFGATLDGVLARTPQSGLPHDPMARLEEAVDRDIAALDRLIARQLDALLHRERLQRLEASWRGLQWLVESMPYGAKVKVKVFTARWAELCRDFDRAAEFDQSTLFRKVHEDEFGQAGGEPYGMLIADYEVRHGPGPGYPTDDISALGSLATVAAAAFAPTAIAAHPAVFGMDDYSGASAAAEITETLRSADRGRWRTLQSRVDTRFLGVLLPRVLGRPAWDFAGTRADGFRYRETASGARQRVWMSPAYALGATALRAFATNGWPAEIRGALVGDEPRAGVVTGLSMDHYAADPPGPPARPPSELALTDDQERECVEAGIIPLIGLEGLPEASFAAMPTLHRPPRMDRDEANANQRLSAQFNAMLCVSRFAHCVKVIGRDLVGSRQDASEIRRRLADWLLRFTNSSAPAEGDAGARYPLRGSDVEVTEKPGQPGVYGCIIHLQPHYQLDEVGASFRLVTDLEAARALA